MPWNYLSSARTALRTLASPTRRKYLSPSALSPKSAPFHRCTPRFSSSRAAEQTVLHQDDEPLPIDIPSALTAAQTSRAARQAVNMALEKPIGGVEDALFIVNSLHHIILKQLPGASEAPNVVNYPAMTFNQVISPRLSSHALVHGLVRRKKTNHAAHLAIAMMQCGMRVNRKTLDLVMGGLKPSGELPRTGVKAALPENFSTNPKTLEDLPAMAMHSGTRLALEIFTIARKSGQGNTSGLFGTLLAICLINTEIVLASLIFATVVKEFYHPPPCREGDTTEQTWNAAKYGPRSLVFLPQWGHLNAILAPLKNHFQHVTTLTTTSHEFDRNSFEANLQALAILANLLDLRHLHLPTISSLLFIMYSTPRVDSQVWVMDQNGNVQSVVAYEYFHDVLVRLIESPPPNHRKGYKPTAAYTPPYLINTCNTLLHYSLRHCHSSDLANKVLLYLSEDRKLTPNETTHNILLRSGTLLRDSEIASAALSAISTTVESRKGRPKDKPMPQLSNNKPLQTLAHSSSPQARTIASIITKIHKLQHFDQTANGRKEVKKALYTLTTQIMHFCSTGKPHYAKIVTFALFPSLQYPAMAQPIGDKNTAVFRASAYGTPTYATLLNALVKARAFPEARLLYNFAIAAERRSWFTPEPWTLGSEVYTIMLELCAAECREAQRDENSPDPAKREASAEMRTKALRMALRLYKRLNRIRYFTYNTMRRYEYLKNWEKLGGFPQFDERFATALVKVLVMSFETVDPALLATPDVTLKHEHPTPRIQTKLSYPAAREKFYEADNDMRVNKKLPEGWSDALQFMAKGIVKAGLDVPPRTGPWYIVEGYAVGLSVGKTVYFMASLGRSEFEDKGTCCETGDESAEEEAKAI
ncbi:hypothetical protein H0H92_008369 [Tricholoma furcatifolium]|nr:hypothetical protein H0H92_008369 [Tricholoma furcatifolium]